MSRAVRCIAPVLLVALCTGCMSIYRMPAGTPAASMRLPSGVTSWICAGGPPQILARGKDGRALIPSGERVTVGANFASSDGYMNYSCSASVSLSPHEGARYYQDFETEDEKCIAMVYRETDDPRVGLEFEGTLGRGGAGCTR